MNPQTNQGRTVTGQTMVMYRAAWVDCYGHEVMAVQANSEDLARSLLASRLWDARMSEGERRALRKRRGRARVHVMRFEEL